MAFYRKHTEKMLRRYLYASMLVGRAPAILGEPIGRGWVSSRKVKTFEDAVIFVLDIENCLKKLRHVDQAILSRVVLQEYTHAETAAHARRKRAGHILQIQKSARQPHGTAAAIGLIDPSAFIIAGASKTDEGSAFGHSPSGVYATSKFAPGRKE